jgi:hypothetical protein
MMKWLSIVALLLAMVFWPLAGSFQIELNLVVSVAAAIVLVQAFQARNYVWAAGFLAVAVLFNPLFPVFQLSGILGLALVVFTIAPFAISLVALRPNPLLSAPSITDRTPGRRSL